ncbi:hypothetical protein PINS_up010427 [Pythium insidiosum]|nr:hypothetical protein PINS_up010427 [Pythium insidiosum]
MRQRLRMAQLLLHVDALRHEVGVLEARRSLRQQQLLRRRHTGEGSLAGIANDYYVLFQRGFCTCLVHGAGRGMCNAHSACVSNAQRQRQFISTIMMDDVVTGDLVGRDAALFQWQVISSAFDGFQLRVDRVSVCGSEDAPLVQLHATLRVRVSRRTLLLLFPGAERNPRLVERFVNFEGSFAMVTSLRFDANSRISFEHVNISIVQGFQAAGFSLPNIVELMQHCVLTPTATVHRDRVPQVID